MGKQNWKPGNMLNPVPAVMVSVADKAGKSNIITIAWAGTVCTNPPMVSISVRPERYSYHMIEETGEFVMNLTTKELVKACDYCGVTSGRDVDKFEKMNLTPLPMQNVNAPGIAESPVNIACKVVEPLEVIPCFWQRLWELRSMMLIWMRLEDFISMRRDWLCIRMENIFLWVRN